MSFYSTLVLHRNFRWLKHFLFADVQTDSEVTVIFYVSICSLDIYERKMISHDIGVSAHRMALADYLDYFGRH